MTALNPALVRMVEQSRSKFSERGFMHSSFLVNELLRLGLAKATKAELRAALQETLRLEIDMWSEQN